MTEKRLTIYANDLENCMPLPELNTIVLLEITSVVSPSHFFVQFPYGIGDGGILVDSLRNVGESFKGLVIGKTTNHTPLDLISSSIDQ